jgi:hypothetical protein
LFLFWGKIAEIELNLKLRAECTVHFLAFAVHRLCDNIIDIVLNVARKSTKHSKRKNVTGQGFRVTPDYGSKKQAYSEAN